MRELKRNMSSIIEEVEIAWIDSFETEINNCKKEGRKLSTSNILSAVIRKISSTRKKMDTFFTDAEERLEKRMGNKKGFFGK